MRIQHFFLAIVGFLILNTKEISAQKFEKKRVRGLVNLKADNGVAVADYDQDGNLDIYVVANQGFDEQDTTTWNRLFRNGNDATFEDVTEVSGLKNINNQTEAVKFNIHTYVKNGASWGDYNNDGYPDLYLANYKNSKLFRNEGNGSFKNVTELAGLKVESDCYASSACWFDFNRDGHLDLLRSNWAECENDRFYINNGDGTFSERSDLLNPFQDNHSTWMVLPLDVNDDSWVDLYFSNDFQNSKLLVNEEGQSFSDESAQFNMVETGHDMGMASGDCNNDGVFDDYITDINENSFLIKNGDRFENRAKIYQVDDTGWGWQVKFADLDLDGDEDLFTVAGYFLPEKSTYFKNQFDGNALSFSNYSASGLQEEQNSRCFELFDYDHDGDLDAISTDINEAPLFYENQLISVAQTTHTNWLKVKLEGTTSNRDAIGSKVSIETQDGNNQMRYFTGVGLMSQSLQPVHFGVGSNTKIKKLIIKWPTGEEQFFLDLPVNKTIHVIENEGFQILEFSSNKIAGCTDVNSCSYDPNATIDDGSCTYLKSKVISGRSATGQISTETYQLALDEGSTCQWTVDGGKILEGNGSSTIKVKWGIGSAGRITAIEKKQCSSLPSILDVTLNTADVDPKFSIARLWNEALLEAIRGDHPRPTVSARNLYHVSLAMYEAWAIYDETARTYLIDKGAILSEFDIHQDLSERNKQISETLSYAVFGLLQRRFLLSPSSANANIVFRNIMIQLGYDVGYTSKNYTSGDAAALGNYIANKIINYGIIDGSKESNNYQNTYYKSSNPPLIPFVSGNSWMKDPNQWQPLAFDVFIDQTGNIYIDRDGNVVGSRTPEFLSAEWGNVKPFALKESDKKRLVRSENEYVVYHDPGAPPYLDTLTQLVQYQGKTNFF